MSEEIMNPTADERAGRPSASVMERLMLCPGSWQAGAKCDPEEETQDAATGTRLHKCMELGNLPDDDEEREACDWCRKTENTLTAAIFGARVAEAGVPAPELQELREQRLWSKDGSYSGQADVIYTDGISYLVLDYKFGRGEVTAAANNPQLAALAALVADNFEGVRTVYAGILQPYVSRQKPELAAYNRSALDGIGGHIARIIGKANEPNAPLKAGAKQCKYCPAAASCPALTLTMQQGVLTDFQKWQLLTPEQRKQAWDWAKTAKRAAAKIEEMVKLDLLAEVEIPGLSLTADKKAFTVTDPAAAFNILAAELGITGEEFTECCSVKITPLDKLIHGKLKAQFAKQTTAQSRDWLREKLAECSETKVSDGSVTERRWA